MTAIVGILNKRAAVLAADSAITVTNQKGRKIINTGNKIFRLSKTQPVGVMYFNNVMFMGTPLDVIFHLYRDARGERQFNTVLEYAEDFIDFVRDEDFFCSQAKQHDYCFELVKMFYHEVKDAVTQKLEEAKDNNLELTKKLVDDFTREVIDACNKEAAEADVCRDFTDYSLATFTSYAKDDIDKLMEAVKEDELPDDRAMWEEALFNNVRAESFNIYSGIIFSGYGSKDIYPSLVPIVVSGALDRRFRFFINDKGCETITHDNESAICPFGQSDVITNLLKGISPDIQETALNYNYSALNIVQNNMVEALKENGVSDDIIAKVMAKADVDGIHKEYEEGLNDYSQENHVHWVFEALEGFDISDMADMAESLISVTSLQRHISSEEESVGGPIDVAVITRSEGFVWYKHKHWYDRSLNSHLKDL